MNLKPCVKCGEKDSIVIGETRYKKGKYTFAKVYFVRCDNCMFTLKEYPFERDAILAWNKQESYND